VFPVKALTERAPMKTRSHAEASEDDAPFMVDKSVGSDTPFTIAEFLVEQGVEARDGVAGTWIDKIAARLYKEKYGVDPPVESSEDAAKRRKLKEEIELAKLTCELRELEKKASDLLWRK
jgi:hypothetical protein